jgi:hypothetical protein
LREPIFDCAPQVCEGAPPFLDGVPFWAILLLLILVALLIVALLQPAKKPDPLRKKVDDALADYEGQASMWDDPEAVKAFAAARKKIDKLFQDYNPPDPVK